MWGRLEALRPFPSSPAVAGTPGRGGAGRAWGWASSLFRPEQLPQPDILLLGEGHFWEELMPRAVSERTWLWPNQGHSIHPLASNFEMKQAAFLQGAKPQPPCGARRPLTMWRWSPHTPQSCPSGVLGRRTWISLLARPCPKNPWFPSAPLGNSYRPARGGVSPSSRVLRSALLPGCSSCGPIPFCTPQASTPCPSWYLFQTSTGGSLETPRRPEMAAPTHGVPALQHGPFPVPLTLASLRDSSLAEAPLPNR